jgi:hypothetical protein
VLVVLFTLASNPKLLTKSRIYVAATTAFILFLPHIYWQYAHGFPSIQYHLMERIDSSYEFSSTFDYLLQQLVLVGPVSSIVLLWAFLRKRPLDMLERALKFTTVGFYLFFLLYSFRGPVEANWTFPAFIGLIVLSHQYLVDKKHLRKLVNVLALITLCIVFLGRLYLAGCLPRLGLKDDEFLMNKEWADDISAKANGLPVFFVDSYQRASKFWFYSGHPAYSLNTLDYRRNGFNFWPLEDSLQHKRMFSVYQGKHRDIFNDSFQTDKGVFLGRVINDYFSFSRILFIDGKGLAGTSNQLLDLQFRCNVDSNSFLRLHPQFDTAHVWMAVYTKDVDEPVILPTTITLKNIRMRNQALGGSVKLEVPAGKYIARLGISSCIPNWPTINSTVFDLQVK